MYLVSLYESEGFVEASLGGRVTADEVRVFGQELMELLAHMEQRPFEVLLDHSRARRMDGDTVMALGDVKDALAACGATTIWCVAADERDQADHQTARFQQVLEGFERFVSEPVQAHAQPVQQSVRRAA